MTHTQIKSRIEYCLMQQNILNAKIEAYNGRIQRCNNKKNANLEKIKYLQSDCKDLGHEGEPCSICGYKK